MRALTWRILAVTPALLACVSHGSRAERGPASGGDRVRVIVPDAAAAPDPEDAGARPDAQVDASAPRTHCERVEAVSSRGEDTPTVTSTDQPRDFIVTRQAVVWNGDCARPVLNIQLSDGSCPAGAGHELVISLAVNDITDGLIHAGQNNVGPELDSSSIRVRYTRPKRLKPAGTWGSCEGAMGQIVFLEAPELNASSELWARYQLMLTACDAETTDVQAVYGVFKVRARDNLRDVCPTRER